MKYENVYIDEKKSGIDQFLLTGVKDWYEYSNGKRTDKQLGYTYEVAMPHRMLEKITIHVKSGDKIKPKMQQVAFTNLQLSLYRNYSNPNELGVKAVADAMREVN